MAKKKSKKQVPELSPQVSQMLTHISANVGLMCSDSEVTWRGISVGTGIPLSTIYSLKNAKRITKMETVGAIADYFSIDAWSLFLPKEQFEQYLRRRVA